MKVGLLLACYPELDRSWSHQSPLGLGYLASYARKYAGSFEFVIERNPDDLIAAKPDLVGVSFVTYNAAYAAEQARRIKESLGCPVICGGPHVSSAPLSLDPAFDLSVLNEGEETFAELLKLYQAEGCFAPQSLSKVKGIAYRDAAGRLVRTTPRPPVADLDSIPFPDRELMRVRWPELCADATIMTSRGCPFDCAFCSTMKIWGRHYRFPSNEYVIREIEEIRTRYNPRTLQFYDDLFIVRKDRVLELLRMIRERRLHENLEMRCSIRSNLLDEELAENLANTNFKIFFVGFESASDEVLKIYNKTAASNATNQRTVDLCRRYGIDVSANFIIGAPGETRADVEKSFAFVRNNMDAFCHVEFAPLMVFPGTEFWNRALEAGYTEAQLNAVIGTPEFIGHFKEYLFGPWVYLNEKNMPRQEIWDLLEKARELGETVWQNSQERKRRAAPACACPILRLAGRVARGIPVLRDFLKRS